MDPQPTPQNVKAEYWPQPTSGPIRVVIVPPRSSWLGTILKWSAAIVLVLLLIGLLNKKDTALTEKWHSLSTNATDKVAIISVEGTILGGESFAKKQIDQVREDEHVKAVVVRVDSPGGTVTGSDFLYHHLKELAREKQIPLVVSMGGIAASGGYYVSMAVGDVENTVYAEPTTWTGSIGVIIPHYDIVELLEKWNIKDDSIASNPLKMMGSPTRKFPEPIRAEEQKILQELVDSSFAGFKEIVLAGRPALRDNHSAQDVVFTGRIFTARQAQDNHLVDRLGFVEDAIDRAIELAGLDKSSVRVVKFEQAYGLVERMLFGPQGRQKPLELAALLEMAVPRAYYMCTWLPAAATLARR
jgi:protease-4